MSLEFFRLYEGYRTPHYPPQPPLLDPATEEEPGGDGVVLDYEVDLDRWQARSVAPSPGWAPESWAERPRRFIDGRDLGETVAWLRAPGGYPVPVRLSQIGAVSVGVEAGVCQRTGYAIERVVSMVVDPFPWHEVESLAEALQARGFRLLPALPPHGRLSYDFEEMRRAAQTRSRTEMELLEEALIARAPDVPTVIDGLLETRVGGFDQAESPIAGVVKTHLRNYLHAEGLQLVYRLEPWERTPLFALPAVKLPVISWYLRLAGARRSLPSWGVVRIELPRRWFERRSEGERIAYADRLSRLICAYRSLQVTYARAAVSLHPIVRAEQLLGALFAAPRSLVNRFYRLAGL